MSMTIRVKLERHESSSWCSRNAGTCPDGENEDQIPAGPRLPSGPAARHLCWLQLVQAPEGLRNCCGRPCEARGPLQCPAGAGTLTARIAGCTGPSIHCPLARVLVSETIERSNVCDRRPRLLCQVPPICPHKSISAPSHLPSAPGGSLRGTHLRGVCAS